MTIKTALVAAVLALSPSLAMAMGCQWGDHSEQAMSCAEGMTWDAATETCVEQVTS